MPQRPCHRARARALITRDPEPLPNVCQPELIMIGPQLQGRGTVLECARWCHREDFRGPECVLIAERYQELIMVPHVVSTSRSSP